MSKVKYILLFLGFGLLNFTLIAQPAWQWAKEIRSNSSETVLGIATDPSNGITYASGYFDGDLSAYFTMGLNGTPNMSAPLGNRDGFVAKYDAAGNVIWAFKIGGISATVEVEAITLAPNGNIYITGEFFNGVVNFQGVTSSIPGLRAPTGSDKNMFLAAYNPNGELIWATSSSDTGNSIGFGIAADVNGIYVAGRFGGDITFPPLAPITWSGSSPFFDAYIAKFDYSGNAIRVKTIFNTTGDGHLKAWNVQTDGNNVFIVGTSGSTSWTYGPTGFNPTDNNNGVAGTEDIWVISIRENNFNLNWTSVIGGVEDDIAKGITLNASGIYLTGGLGGASINFPGLPPVSSIGTAKDIFTCKLFKASGLTDWVQMEQNNTASDAYGADIDIDLSGNLFITGAFVGNTDFNAGGDTKTSSGVKDIFVMSRQVNGNFNWVETAGGAGDDEANGVTYDNNGNVYVGGDYDLAATFGLLNLPTGGGKNGFVAKLSNCTLSITCPSNQTATANAACQYTLLDYTSLISSTASCGVASIVQTPATGTVVSTGVNPITVLLTDNNGNQDSCTFDVIVEAAVNPTVISCGTILTGETTVGKGDTENNFGCVSYTTPGEDIYYQITVPAGNYKLQVAISNVVDATDSIINIFWVGGSCPLGGGCLDSAIYDIATQQFLSGGNIVQYTANGPGTYYFVVDVQIDGIDSYDISFDCLVGVIEFDESTTCGDPNNDGIIPYVNGLTTLNVQTCEKDTFCYDMYIANLNDFQWIDSVYMNLGACYTNVSAINMVGFYEPGNWIGTYDAINNGLAWQFNNTNVATWGDGDALVYSCDNGNPKLYTYCFSADISPVCASNGDLDVNILISDDGVTTSGTIASGIDKIVSTGFTINNPPPTISCPTNKTINNNVGICGAIVNGLTPIINGNCSGTYVTYTLTGATTGSGLNDASGITYNLGLTTIKYIVTDSIGLQDSCSFTITVNDNETPTFTCPSNSNEYVNATCDFSIPDYTGTISGLSDNCTPLGSIIITQSPAIGTAISGHGTTQNITIYATDLNNNIDSCSFTITLLDTIKPTINCPGNQTEIVDANCALVLPSYAAVGVSDNCTASGSIVITQTPIAGAIITTDTLLTLFAADGNGNIDSCSFMVLLSDTTSPTITCPNDTSINNDAGICGANITLGLPVAADNCSITSLLNDFNNTSNASGIYPLGLTTVNWTATDDFSNTATCSFNVTIVDAEKPIITCLPDTVINNDNNSCDAIFNFNITATDNCFYTISQIAGLPSGSTFPQGNTINTFVATDAAGLADTCSFVVTVIDASNPTITCPNDIVICDSNVIVDLPAVGDNCMIATTTNDYNLTNNASSIYPIGITVVEWTVADTSGNINTCAMTVEVEEKPTIANAGEDQNLVLNQNTNFEGNTPVVGSGTWSLISGNGIIDNDFDPASFLSNLIMGDNIFGWTIINGTCPPTYDEVTITVGGLKVPSGFSPNGDGNNDLFVIPGIENVASELIIFNRWGVEIYTATNYQNDWDGISNEGKTLPGDTYFYTIKLPEYAEEYSGYVVIKR